MRCFLFIVLAVNFTATLLAQSSAPSDNKLSEDSVSAPCTVAGRVLTAAEGNPLKSARVALISDHSKSHEQIYAAMSDSDGLFTIKNIPPGRYQFFATHSGFVEQHYKAGANEIGPIFSLRSGEKISDVLFRLTAAAVITGRVSNEEGEGMQRVDVVALRRPSEEETEDNLFRVHKTEMRPVASAQSDDRGQYRIFGLRPGEYYIRAQDAYEPWGGGVAVDDSFWLKRSLGSDYASVYYPGAAQVAQAQVISIKAGEEVQADLVMRRVRTVEIAGHVIGANGPAANAMVNLQPVDGNGADFNRQDTTDEKGTFRLRSVPEGSYYVLVYQRQEGTRMYESRARQRVEVADDNIDSLTISLKVGATIQGRLKVDGAHSVDFDRIGLSLMPVEDDGQPGRHAEVKKDGSFEIRSVDDGSYSFSVWGLDRFAYVKSVRRGPDDLLEKGLQVEGGSSGKIELIIGSDGAQVDGSVADDDGAVIGARVRLIPDPLTAFNHIRSRTTTTDQLGHFSVSDVPPGKYKVTARPMVSSESVSYKSEPQEITFSENDHKTIEIKLVKKQE